MTPRPRPTARVILLDPDDRVMLMRFRDFHDKARAYWATIGGGLEPGESVADAAAREIVEETGISDAVLGPVVWYGEVILAGQDGAPVLMQESYVLARTATAAFSTEGWSDVEREFVTDMRWWRLADIARTRETVFPEGAADLLAPLLAGRVPQTPLVIRSVQARFRLDPAP